MNTPSEPDDENKAPLEPGGASEGSISDASNDENELFDENELATYQSLVVSYLDLEMLSFRSGVDDCVYVFLQKDVDYRVGRGKKKMNSVNKQLK